MERFSRIALEGKQPTLLGSQMLESVTFSLFYIVKAFETDKSIRSVSNLFALINIM
jgi:hypothetical protein